MTGAALATLAAVPVGAYAVAGGTGSGAPTRRRRGRRSAPRTARPSPRPPHPPGPRGRPPTGSCSTDHVRAGGGRLQKCIDWDQKNTPSALGREGLGKAADYRIILAIKSTGDSNAPGDGMYVVATKARPAGFRVICNVRSGEGVGINSGSGDAGPPDAGPVVADINGGKLYQQSFLDKGNWKLPFRWGFIGTVEPSVAKVTVSYGDGGPVTAALDHGWFVAAGILNQQVTVAPHIKGYDAAGKLVYDSDHDKSYERTLP